MSVEEKLDAIHSDVKDLKTETTKQGKCLAKLDERSEQHEKRMDRSDKKATGLGALAGIIGGTAAGAFVKAIFGVES